MDGSLDTKRRIGWGHMVVRVHVGWMGRGIGEDAAAAAVVLDM